jgi:acetyl esterase/lipase
VVNELLLWPDGAPPNARTNETNNTNDTSGPTPDERMGPSPFGGVVRYNVTIPKLEVRRPLPGTESGGAAIICPGGGFHFLTMDNEGHDLADRLVEHGITCFVLSYRMIETPANSDQAQANTLAAFADGANKIDPFISDLLLDATQAVRVVRSQATAFSFDPTRIAMIGFSAGARITATAMLDPDAHSRPNHGAIVYLPTMPAHTVPPDAPPLFIAAAMDDQIATTGNEQLFASWRVAGRPVELHLFERGGHGFGVGPQGLPSDRWTDLLIGWLGSYGYLSNKKPK